MFIAWKNLTTRALVVVSFLMALADCNVIQYQRRRIRHHLEDAGLYEKQVRLGDDTVSYWDGGKGDPVILLHGMGLAALWQWNEQAPVLVGSRRVIVPDLLWFGGSFSARRDFSLSHQVAAINGLLDHLDLHGVDLVGLSYGGIVAYGVATGERQSRIRSLTMVDNPGPTFGQDDYAELLKRLGTQDPTEVFVPQSPAAVHRLMTLAYQHPPYIPDFAARQIIAEGYTANREELRALFYSTSGRIDQLTVSPPKITQPLCIVWGRNDPIFPLSFAEKLRGFALTRTSMHVVPDAKHTPNIEHPKEFNRILQDCLAFGSTVQKQ